MRKVKRKGTVGNILGVFRRATDEEIGAGRAWYEEAYQEVALRIIDMQGRNPDFDMPDRRALAGITAALSPNKTWRINVRLVGNLVSTRDAGQYKSQVCKGLRILDGEDALDVLRGPKERAFFSCLFDPACDSVCVDGHAYAMWRRMVKSNGHAVDRIIDRMGRKTGLVSRGIGWLV